MISDIKSAIVYKLKDNFPLITKRYTDDIPQKFTTPAFVIFQIDQDYRKRLNSKNNGKISFDVSYFSDKAITEIKSDCQIVQESLLREFDLIGTFRAINKNATIVDNVLHFTFDVKYSEMRVEIGTSMQTQTTTTNI